MAKLIDEDSLYTRRFSSLSVRDLLEARDHYHVHLTHKANVIATAVGLYLIRDRDPDAESATTPEAATSRGKLGTRTFENASVRPWSWPCLLVLVENWQTDQDLARPQHVVPPFLYLEDDRIIPVCVVEAKHGEAPVRPIPAGRLDVAELAGGAPVYAYAQGQRRVGSVGCIVTDGADYYALTNKHVAGEPGREIEASIRGAGRTVGTSAATGALGTRSFSEVHEGLAGRAARLQLDAGLIKINNVREWSPAIAGLGKLGRMMDFGAETASLDWIGCPVVASGAASGALQGEVRALFYRYKAVGGREFITDFLIGSRTVAPGGDRAPLLTRPGDSGTLWCVDLQEKGEGLRPLALEWGGQKLGSTPNGDVLTQFALASSVAVVCRELELDIVTDWQTENTDYWGTVGHFKIAQQACFKVENPQLRRFLLDNLDNVSFTDDADIEAAHLTAATFVPLADVPDIVWKTNINRVDKTVTRPLENTNHFADMDLPGETGKTLFEICGSPAKLNLGAWKEFWANAPAPTESFDKNGKPKKASHGCLPFRVWQIFAAAKSFAEQGDVDRFLCAAGILSHYVGDACQPLHGSQHSDGLNGSSVGVHMTYEDNMVEAHADDIARGIDNAMASADFPLIAIGNGNEAGVQVVELMRRCAGVLPPEFICNSFTTVHPGHKSPTKGPAVLDAMWADCGAGTVLCIADGIRVLASLWQAAFQNAVNDGAAFAGKRDPKRLRPIYNDHKFLESKHIEKFTNADLP